MTTMLPTRAGLAVKLSVIIDPSARRTERATALNDLERGLRRGWVHIEPSERLIQCTKAFYDASEAAFADSTLCAAYRREVLCSGDYSNLALTYLGPGEEPLYDPKAASQRVRSFNIHEALPKAEVDARLPAAYDEEERALAHAYHSAMDDPATTPLLGAAAELRESLSAECCGPLLQGLAVILGLDATELASRCGGQRSDNTSLLRALEYPASPSSTPPDAAGAVASASEHWGVSAHTDFELFSLLHEQSSGLQIFDTSEEVWVEPRAHGALKASPWVLIVGDMLARLSSGYFIPTPHRVRLTSRDAAAPRRSIVFFQAFDELEIITPISAAVARRSPSITFRRWWDEGDAARLRKDADTAAHRARGNGETSGVDLSAAWTSRELLLHPQPMTQRDWQELKEAAARERVRATTA
jgi:hypothetical protein